MKLLQPHVAVTFKLSQPGKGGCAVFQFGMHSSQLEFKVHHLLVVMFQLGRYPSHLLGGFSIPGLGLFDFRCNFCQGLIIFGQFLIQIALFPHQLLLFELDYFEVAPGVLEILAEAIECLFRFYGFFIGTAFSGDTLLQLGLSLA